MGEMNGILNANMRCKSIGLYKVNPQKLKELAGQPPTGEMEECGIALGYFDYVTIEDIVQGGSESFSFSALSKHSMKTVDNITPEFYSKNINTFKVLDNSELREKDTEFWECKKDYMFITFVYTNDSFQEIEQFINGENSEDVEFTVYKTLVSTDYVIYWKSDDFYKVWKIIHKICITDKLLYIQSIPLIKESKVKEYGGKNPPRVRNDEKKIEGVEIRFILKNYDCARKFFKQLEQFISVPWKVSLINGVEDINLQLDSSTIRELLTFLNFCYYDEEGMNLFESAFYECETAVLSEISLDNIPDLKKGDNVTFQYEELLNGLNEITIGDLPQADQLWFKTFKIQFNYFIDCYKSDLLHSMFYSISKSVLAFAKHVIKIQQNEPCYNSKQTGACQAFVRDLSVIIREVMGSEVTFVTRPRWSLNLYDLQINMLEFYNAFVNECMGIMSCDETTMKSGHTFLLTPKICRRIKVIEIFELDNTLDNELDSVIAIDIPLEIKHNPFYVLSMLTHEVSHFSGDNWRNRDLRVGKYADCIAYTVLSLAGFKNPEVYKQMMMELRVFREGYICLDENKNMDWLTTHLLGEVERILAEKYAVYLRLEFVENSNNITNEDLESIKKYAVFNELKLMKNNYFLGVSILPFVEAIADLFKECYADISMLCMLNLSQDEYLALVNTELNNCLIEIKDMFGKTYEKEDCLNNSSYVYMVMRYSLVIYTFYSKGYELNSNDTNMRMFVECIEWYTEVLENGVLVDNPLFFSVEITYKIIEYLQSCKKTINGSLLKPENEIYQKKWNTIKRIFDDVVRMNFIGDEFYALVREHRKM